MAVRRSTKLPAIPKLSTKDPQLAKFGAAVTELLQVWAGTKNAADKVITVGDLVDSGGFSFSGISAGSGGSGGTLTFDGEVTLDTTPCPAVTGFTTRAGLTSVFMTWTASAASNFAYYELWRCEADTFDGSEVLIGTCITPMYVDAVGDTKKTYYYWIRAVNTSDIPGAFNAALGESGATASVALTDFASGLTPVEIVAVLPTTDNFEGRQALLTTDKKLYRYVSGAWSKAVDGGDISSASIVTGSIATGAINAGQIAANAVTAGNIAAGTVTADRMNVTQLSAIAANLGSITGGSLNINSKFVVDSSGNTTIQSAASGQRLVMQNNVIKVYDSSGVKRVQIGDLTA